MSVTYDDVYNFLYSEKFSELVPDSYALSQPILSKKNGNIVDNFFVSYKKEGHYFPIYKFGIDVEAEMLIYIQKYDTDLHTGDISNPIGLNKDEYLRYQALYEHIRKMYAFSEKIETDTIVEYSILLLKFIPNDLINYYNDLSHDFFDFLMNKLKG